MTTSSPSTIPSSALRLQLSPGEHHGPLDGAWWPRSRNIETELADLVDHFPIDVGRIERVVFSRPDWDTTPRRVKVARGYLKTASFPRDDTHVVLLHLAHGVQLRVLVLPPELRTNAARDIMNSATASTNRRIGPDLLDGSRDAFLGDFAGRWSDDGGASEQPRAEPASAVPADQDVKGQSTTSASREEPAFGPLRLLPPPGGWPGTVTDRLGVWRPYSRDLTREGAQLVDEFPAELGRITTLLFSPVDWDVADDHVDTHQGPVRTRHFPADQSHRMVLRIDGSRTIRLQVEHTRPLAHAPV